MIPFRDEQRAYWRAVDEPHFRWQTGGGPIAESEARLLSAVDVAPGERLLEIGCGEGANLHHLRTRGARLFGVDFTVEKARFARGSGALTACADAEHLPFADGAFDAVLIRDLLHHVADRLAVVAEAARVLRPGGRITVIEPNGRNPIIFAQATAIRAERGMRKSNAERLAGELVRAGFPSPRVAPAQPLPIARVVLHYKLGAPFLGAIPPVRWALAGLERAAGALPPSVWAYLVAHARKPS